MNWPGFFFSRIFPSEQEIAGTCAQDCFLKECTQSPEKRSHIVLWEPRGGSCRKGHLWEGLTEEVLFGLNLAVQIRAAREDAIKWHIIT